MGNGPIFPHISRYFLKSPENHNKPKFKTNNGLIFPHISRHFLKTKAPANYSKPKFKTNNGPTFPHISRDFLPPKRKNSQKNYSIVWIRSVDGHFWVRLGFIAGS